MWRTIFKQSTLNSLLWCIHQQHLTGKLSIGLTIQEIHLFVATYCALLTICDAFQLEIWKSFWTFLSELLHLDPSQSLSACSKMPASCMCCWIKQEQLPQSSYTQKFRASLQSEGVRLSLIAPLPFPFVFLQSRELQLLLFLEVGSFNLLELCTWIFPCVFSVACRTFSDLWFMNNSL